MLCSNAHCLHAHALWQCSVVFDQTKRSVLFLVQPTGMCHAASEERESYHLSDERFDVT